MPPNTVVPIDCRLAAPAPVASISGTTLSATFSYDPNGQFDSLGLGQTATDTFAYTVADNVIRPAAWSR